MKMLFLDSLALMIIIVTDLAWESVPPDLYPLISQQLYLQTFPEPALLADLVLKLSQDVCLGKGVW